MLTGLRYRGKLRKLEAISLKISMILYIARVFRSNFLDMNSFIKLRKPFGQTIIISYLFRCVHDWIPEKNLVAHLFIGLACPKI